MEGTLLLLDYCQKCWRAVLIGITFLVDLLIQFSAGIAVLSLEFVISLECVLKCQINNDRRVWGMLHSQEFTMIIVKPLYMHKCAHAHTQTQFQVLVWNLWKHDDCDLIADVSQTRQVCNEASQPLGCFSLSLFVILALSSACPLFYQQRLLKPAANFPVCASSSSRPTQPASSLSFTHSHPLAHFTWATCIFWGFLVFSQSFASELHGSFTRWKNKFRWIVIH